MFWCHRCTSLFVRDGWPVNPVGVVPSGMRTMRREPKINLERVFKKNELLATPFKFFFRFKFYTFTHLESKEKFVHLDSNMVGNDCFS